MFQVAAKLAWDCACFARVIAETFLVLQNAILGTCQQDCGSQRPNCLSSEFVGSD